ncbi:MAG: cupredoxin domain-containing protein [Mycobacteriales bacterium]|nr:cupredoxin domain-containing protein [Frankia sp.]
MPGHRRNRALAAAAFAMLVVGACGGDEGGGGGTPDLPPGDRTQSPGALGGSGNNNIVMMTARDFAFAPVTFTAVKGQAVNISLSNEGDSVHNFSNADFKVDQDVSAGQTATVTFTPTKTGTFTFVCKYHAAQGMKGTFDVAS